MRNRIEEKISKFIKETEVSNIVAPELNVDSERTSWLRRQGKNAEGLPEGRGMQASGVFEAESQKTTCPSCSGTGKHDDDVNCVVCRGSGKVTRKSWEKHYGNPATAKKEGKLREQEPKSKSLIGKNVSIEMYSNAKFSGMKGKVIKQLSNGKYLVKLQNGQTVTRNADEIDVL